MRTLVVPRVAAHPKAHPPAITSIVAVAAGLVLAILVLLLVPACRSDGGASSPAPNALRSPLGGGPGGTPGNTAPAIASAPPGGAQVGVAWAYKVAATDPDGDPLAYALSVAPGGMTIDVRAGVVTWTPAPGQEGAHAVRIAVGDGRDTTEPPFTLVVSPPGTATAGSGTGTGPAAAASGGSGGGHQGRVVSHNLAAGAVDRAWTYLRAHRAP